MYGKKILVHGIPCVTVPRYRRIYSDGVSTLFKYEEIVDLMKANEIWEVLPIPVIDDEEV